jgi:hypothetical protein
MYVSIWKIYIQICIGMTQDVQDLDIMELQHGKYFGKSLQKDT